MKPFNLQEALEGKPVITRDGKEILWVKEVPEGNDESNVVAYADGWYNTKRFFSNGKYLYDRDHALDLFMRYTKKKAYINIYPESRYTPSVRDRAIGAGLTTGLEIYTSREQAERRKTTGRLAVAVAEWEE